MIYLIFYTKSLYSMWEICSVSLSIEFIVRGDKFYKNMIIEKCGVKFMMIMAQSIGIKIGESTSYLCLISHSSENACKLFFSSKN